MNIAQILKDVPKGTKLYSPLFGECEFVKIEYNDYDKYPIIIRDCGGDKITFTEDGKYYSNDFYTNTECILFPSKENRDWNTFVVTKPKIEHEFKPFDPVLVRDYESGEWRCNYFSHMIGERYVCVGSTWKYCIPYNNTTKHLVGTNESL